jgi:transglutaminase/protease-like cytokinesis protein 3
LSERFLLYTIDDGEWHTLTEVAKELEWPIQRVLKVTRYLAQGRFIHYDEQTEKVKIQPWVRKYPRGEWIKPSKRSTGTVLIPPDGSVTLQETVIYNTLEAEVEVNFMVLDERLAELLITKSE